MFLACKIHVHIVKSTQSGRRLVEQLQDTQMVALLCRGILNKPYSERRTEMIPTDIFRREKSEETKIVSENIKPLLDYHIGVFTAVH